MSNSSPYHEGELYVQDRAGEREIGRRNGAVIANTIIRGALRFVSQQPFVVMGSTDADDRVWASAIFGQPGFMSASERSIEIDLTRTRLNHLDPFWENVELYPKIGALVIELERRRRLRVNGRIVRIDNDRLRLDVAESYPNCPKYIQRRTVSVSVGEDSETLVPTRRDGTSLTTEQQAWIVEADTMFVASAHPERGVDASHRGGDRGFIEVVDDSTLRVPDYAGNGMFNTLGNFAANPQAGLLFMDYTGRRTLQLVGKAKILWDLDVPDHETGGTRRYWEFEIERSVEMHQPTAPIWEFVDYSPLNP